MFSVLEVQDTWEVTQSHPLPTSLGRVGIFHTLSYGGLTTLYQLAVRHCLVLMEELACTLLVILECNGFPTWQRAYSLAPGPLGSGELELDLELTLGC